MLAVGESEAQRGVHQREGLDRLQRIEVVALALVHEVEAWTDDEPMRIILVAIVVLLAASPRAASAVETHAEREARAHYDAGEALFAKRAGFGEAETRAMVEPGASQACWSPREKLIVRLVDELHETAGIGDELWQELAVEFRDEPLIELIMLAGSYHMVSFLVNALRLPLEPYAARFATH